VRVRVRVRVRLRARGEARMATVATLVCLHWPARSRRVSVSVQFVSVSVQFVSVSVQFVSVSVHVLLGVCLCQRVCTCAWARRCTCRHTDS